MAIVVATAWLAAVATAMLAFAVRSATTFAGSSSDLVLAGLVLAIVSDASVGAILVLRRPGNVIGLVLMLAAILPAITLFAWVWGAALTEQRGHHDFLAGLASLIGALGFVPSIFVGGPLLALLFPTGRLPGPRWRWPIGAVVVAVAVASAIGLLHPGSIPATAVDNPFGVSAFFGSEAFLTIGIVLTFASLPVALLLAVAAVIVRVRRSEGIERAQLKWFVGAVFAVGTFVTLGFADGGLDVGLAAGTSPTIFDVLAVASLSLPAIAVGIAILRYHLFEIDRIISRTLSYGAVTAVLAVVFGLAAASLGILLGSFAEGQTIAVAGSTLLVVALFGPLRRRAQTIVDRRFDRSSYDASLTVEAMTERLRDDVDLARVEADVLGVLDRTFHPVTAGMWLRGVSR